MRLYLSSFRLGAPRPRLWQLLGSGRRTACVTNALDGVPAADREAGLRRDLAELTAAGLNVSLVDLREPRAAEVLAAFDLVWVRGGHVFVLRKALAESGGDVVLLELLARDAIVYGGYSAGSCVLSPDLTELRSVDDLHAVVDPLTSGLGVLDRPFVPHVDSPGHPETAACGEIADRYRRRGQPHWTLRDGQVLVVDASGVEVLSP